MNILFIASVYRHLTAFHIPYMKLLQSKGYQVWAAGFDDGVQKKELINQGFICIDIPFNRSPLKRDNMVAYNKLLSLFKENNFELIHVHTPVAALISRLAFRKTKYGKILYSAHGFHFYKGAPISNWLLYYPMERILSRLTDALITTNDEDYKRSLKMGFKKDTIHLVNGVGVKISNENLSPALVKEFKKEIGIKENTVVISYIAELNQNKNHLFLLKNWKTIKENCPNAVLLLVGEGEYRGQLEEFIVEEKIKDALLLGYRTDVQKILSISDIVSLLSHREGLPKSIMEAMASKLPCIVSDTRGLRDLILDGENGYVIKLGENDKLVKAFISLINDKNLRGKLGDKGFDYVHKFSLNIVMDDYRRIYEELLSKY